MRLLLTSTLVLLLTSCVPSVTQEVRIPIMENMVGVERGH